MKKHNFYAGPAVLPQEVFQKASEAALDFHGTGLSLLEISHRSAEFDQVMVNARAIVKRLMNLGDDYEVLFLQGGATLQFSMIPYNLLSLNGKAAYLNTGRWSTGAIKDAKVFGQLDVVATSEDTNFNYIPKNYSAGSEYDYFYCTSNNTIRGTEIKEFPEVEAPLVCDMSSDIFSRPLDFSKFGLIYAGAQKNMGPAGTTLVVVKKDLLGKTGRKIPSYLDYQVHIDKDSLFNTPPTFSIYTALLTLQKLEGDGGLKAAQQRNEAKAALLYAEIDRNPYFDGFAAKDDRSLMNVTFTINDEGKKEEFDRAWKEAGIVGLKGHRSIGGYRASIYNSLPIESVELLVQVMKSL